MKIINIGKVPPPIGGVTTFIKRLKYYLDKNNIDNMFIDISGIDTERKRSEGYLCLGVFRAFVKILQAPKSVIMFHTAKPQMLAAASVLSIKHRIVIFVHGETTITVSVHRGIWRKALANIDYFLTPTEELKDKLGVHFPEMKRRVISVPFILFPEKSKNLSDQSVIALKNKVDYLLGIYACELKFYKGLDLYGLDMAIELIHSLRQKGYNVGLIMLLPDISNHEFYISLCRKIKELKLEDYIVRIEKAIEDASSLYRLIDLYIRPTNTDGDAFSIWESLYVKTPVLASDITVRPEGCILFESRNQEAFNDRAEKVLKNYSHYKEKVMKLEIHGSEDKLIRMLERITKAGEKKNDS